jgi:hypothetical protein
MLLKSNTGPRWSWLLLAGALVALPAVAADARITAPAPRPLPPAPVPDHCPSTSTTPCWRH